MKIRTFLGGYGCAVVALLAVLSSVEIVLGQQEVQLERGRTNRWISR